MFEIPLLDDEYREPFLYLLDQIDLIKSYSDNNKPWYPKDEERLGEAFSTAYRDSGRIFVRFS